jgi:hypothetical protein
MISFAAKTTLQYSQNVLRLTCPERTKVLADHEVQAKAKLAHDQPLVPPLFNHDWMYLLYLAIGCLHATRIC